MICQPESPIVIIQDEKREKVIGAGVLVGKKWVLTCGHVIEDVSSHDQIYLTFHLDTSGKPHKSHVLFSKNDNESDIAILELDDAIPQCASVGKFVIKNNLWDHKLKCCGFPLGNDGEWVSVVGRNLVNSTSVQIDVLGSTGYNIEEGFSGTPVFDAESNYIVGIIVSREISVDVLSGCFISINSIINICKRNSVDTKIFESLYDLNPPITPIVKIARLIATNLNKLPDETITYLVKEHNIDIAPGLRDRDLCFHLAMAMLNLRLGKALQILKDLKDYNMSSEDINSIFTLLIPFWVDPESAVCVSERALHKDNKKAVALNVNKHSFAKMCVHRASGHPPSRWPTYSYSGKYGINVADGIVKEIEDLLRIDMLRSGYLNEDMNLNEQRMKIKYFVRSNKENDIPTFFILNYSKDIANSLTSAQEVCPCITLFLLTGDAYPQPNEFGKLDCACLLNLGLKAEKQIFDEINYACFSLYGNSKFNRVIEEYLSDNDGISKNI